MAVVHIPCYGIYALIVKAKNSILPRLFPHDFVRSYQFLSSFFFSNPLLLNVVHLFRFYGLFIYIKMGAFLTSIDCGLCNFPFFTFNNLGSSQAFILMSSRGLFYMFIIYSLTAFDHDFLWMFPLCKTKLPLPKNNKESHQTCWYLLDDEGKI